MQCLYNLAVLQQAHKTLSTWDVVSLNFNGFITFGTFNVYG